MSDNYKVSASVQEQPKLMVILGSTAILGCVIFCVSILIADFVVPTLVQENMNLSSTSVSTHSQALWSASLCLCRMSIWGPGHGRQVSQALQ